jgi:hypothetical protein
MGQQHRALSDKLTAKVKADPEFLQRLIKDPKGVADEVNGGPIPEESAIRLAHPDTVLENSRDTDIVVRVPEDTDLSIEELESVAGGVNISCGPNGSTNIYKCGAKLTE